MGPERSEARWLSLVQLVFGAIRNQRAFLDGRKTLSELEDMARLHELAAVILRLDVPLMFEGSLTSGQKVCLGCAQKAYEEQYRRVVGPLKDLSPRMSHNHK